MKRTTITGLIGRAQRLLLAAAVGLIVSAPLAAQCAMCRESAAYQRAEAILSLQHGIIVLGVPPLAIAIGIACLTYRYRGTHRSAKDPDAPTISE